MKFLNLIFCLCSFFVVQAQEPIIFGEPVKMIVKKRIGRRLSAGEQIELDLITKCKIDGVDEILFQVRKTDGDFFFLRTKEYKKFALLPAPSLHSFWVDQQIKNGAFDAVLQQGQQSDLRQSLKDEANQYVASLDEANSFLEDDYLSDYVYGLLLKVKPVILRTGRTDNLSIRIVKDVTPRSFTLANGCIFLTTGLLTALETEDELVAILAHEVVHYVLDLQVAGFNEQERLAKKLNFWSGFAVLAATTTEAVDAIQNDYAADGEFTANTASLAYWISQDVIYELGIKLSKEQAATTDKVTIDVIKKLGYNKNILSLALQHIKDYCSASSNYTSIVSGGDFYQLNSRITTLGLPKENEILPQSDYLKMTSSLRTSTAWSLLTLYGQVPISLRLAERNIAIGLATETDYLVAAIAKRRTGNSPETYLEVLQLLNKAKQVNISPYALIYKLEALSFLHLDRKEEAKSSFNTYLDMLETIEQNGGSVATDIIWAKTMLFKLERM